MFAFAALVAGALIIGFLAFAASTPGSFRIERSIWVDAPADRVFSFLNDFHQWALWSPWEKLDADLKRDYSGKPSGKGAIYDWNGARAGVGRMEIIEADAPTRLLIHPMGYAPSDKVIWNMIH